MAVQRTALDYSDRVRSFLLILVGYLAADCRVPDIHRKPRETMSVWW